ncbi:hypothetical protein [Deinococcus sp.]|uniref:hypothetical protein n=1 Tax=Deinococcus sp. TaxID=47478 RepID=UPI0025EBD9A4|nr:hypothetical protein [Deinococcus sp.]
MSYEQFYSRFPELAIAETRVITIFPDSVVPLPPGEYGLMEAYCTEPGCDCRRVFLNVVAPGKSEVQAVISYGWERRAFYVRWFGRDDPDVIRELKGPALALGQPQSALAPQILDTVKQVVLTDQAYVQRLKRHYQMFRASLPTPIKSSQAPRR